MTESVGGSAEPDRHRPVTSGTTEVLEAVLGPHRPALAAHLAELDVTAWSVVDPVLLELCRVRIAMLLGCGPEIAARTEAAAVAGLDDSTLGELASWPTSPRFGERERAGLAFCEQFVIDVAGTTDELADAVSDHLGPQGLADFVAALLVIEQRQRLRLAWERLLVPVGTA